MARLSRRPALAGTALLPLLLAIGLAGCDSGGDSAPGASAAPVAPPVSARVVPSLGKTFAADVRVIAPGGGGLAVAELARNKTQNDGEADIELPADTDGPFIVEVEGNDAATYFDEGTGTELPLHAGDVIRTIVAALPADGAGIAVTPLTEMACKYLEAAHGPLADLTKDELATIVSSGELADALERVRQELAPELPVGGLTDLPKLVGSVDDYAALGDGAADLYALKLAALAKVAHQNGADRPALKMLERLSHDLKDGTVDGKEGLAALPVDAYDVNQLAKQLKDAAQSLATSGDLQTALPLLQRYASNLLVALSEMHEAAHAGGDGGGDDTGGGSGDPVLPGDRLASWLGDYHGHWKLDELSAEVYIWPFGWKEDKLTEVALGNAMSLMTFGGEACNWVVGVKDVKVGNLVVPFAEAYAVAAQGDARTYTLPTQLTVLEYGLIGTTVIDTQGVLPTRISFDNQYKGPLHRWKYKGTCTFEYKA